MLGAAAYAVFFPASRAWLLAPLDLGHPTLATISGVGPGFAGLLFGAFMIGVSFLLPTHPGQRTGTVHAGHLAPPSQSGAAG
jgi:hypothetical protein